MCYILVTVYTYQKPYFQEMKPLVNDVSPICNALELNVLVYVRMVCAHVVPDLSLIVTTVSEVYLVMNNFEN